MPSNLIKWKKHSGILAKSLKASFSADPSGARTCSYTDCTLICGGQRFPCHRTLLSAHSEFFDVILREHPVYVEPVILLDEVDPVVVENMVRYMYTGIVSIHRDKAKQFMQWCSYLRIKGLMSHDMTDTDDSEDEDENATITLMEPPEVASSTRESTPAPPEPEPAAYQPPPNQITQLRIKEPTSPPPPPEPPAAVQPPTNTAVVTEKIPNANNSEEIKDESDILENRRSSRRHAGPDPPPPTQNPIVYRNTMKMIANCPVPEQSEAGSPKTARKRRKTEWDPMSPSSPEKRKRPSEGYTPDQLNDSIEAVCRGDMNLTSASEHYRVPKSVLWRNLQKRPDYNPHKADENRERAKAELANGESIAKISVKYSIPVATLYRDRQKMIANGEISGVEEKRPKEEFEDSMRQAIAAVQKGMAQSEAAKVFDVPKSTLWRKMKKMGMNL